MSKVHNEKWRNRDKTSHNLEFSVERNNLLTRSPPAKKVKDNSTETVINQEKDKKKIR